MLLSQIETKPSMAFVAVRVLLPFACGYFLSYLFRSVNAVIAPNLQHDLGIGAGDLGTLTAAFFITFAAAQLPVGILLDRYGPPKVQAGLLIIGALGAALFATAGNLTLLAFARSLIGLGFAGGLMSAMKAIAIWLPRERWAVANGVFLTAGGIGALVATVPVEWSLQYTSWQMLFWFLGGFAVLAALLIYFVVPDEGGGSDNSLIAQLKDCGIFLLDRHFWRIAPVSIMGMGSGMAIQTLWCGPFLRDVGGLNQAEAARIQFMLAVALTVGFTLTGIIADRLQRFGITLAQTMATTTLLYIVCLCLLTAGFVPASPLLWIAFGVISMTTVLAYPITSGMFPVEKSGRVNALLNAVVFGLTFIIQAGMGWLIDLWPKAVDGRYPPEAYSWAFGIPTALLILSLVWYVLPRRDS
ncbi:MAG TPA: MFS transporter [Ferrovibrio sp.]|uniref:MFS transporter n=1 Tax=Ferrovibrio sp. TaxID=1917215 RepID=UPI002ED157DF